MAKKTTAKSQGVKTSKKEKTPPFKKAPSKRKRKKNHESDPDIEINVVEADEIIVVSAEVNNETIIPARAKKLDDQGETISPAKPEVKQDIVNWTATVDGIEISSRTKLSTMQLSKDKDGANPHEHSNIFTAILNSLEG